MFFFISSQKNFIIVLLSNYIIYIYECMYILNINIYLFISVLLLFNEFEANNDLSSKLMMFNLKKDFFIFKYITKL